MKIALIAPPFIPVPPHRYGGTELFLAHLAEGLRRRGEEPVVYGNGESRVGCEVRWLFPRGEWPVQSQLHASLKELAHSSWACRDALRDCDVVHLNNAPGLALAPLLARPVVYTLHHPRETSLSAFYGNFPQVRYVAISRRQAARESLPRVTVIPHGLDTSRYRMGGGRREYLCTVGRISPQKGMHHAIAVARRCGIPLKIAGEIQPLYREYWERQVRPHVDGRWIEYVGELDLEGKNQLLGGARAFLFPIEWEEPFGLVMLEAMACGAPVLAFSRGAAPEVVADGVSGWLCANIGVMAARAPEPGIDAWSCRRYVEARFSIERMVERYARVYAAAAVAETAGAPGAGAALARIA